jgi:hypothetical protein
MPFIFTYLKSDSSMQQFDFLLMVCFQIEREREREKVCVRQQMDKDFVAKP